MTSAKLPGIDIESFIEMLDDFPVSLWIHDENHTIIYGNNEFQKNFGDCLNQRCHQCLMGKQNTCRCCLSYKSLENDKTERCKLCRRNNSGYDFNIFHTPMINIGEQKYMIKSSFHINDLSILEENLPTHKEGTDKENIYLVMCSACNKVKDSNDNWVAIDSFLIETFNFHISHGICPGCTEVLYPNLNLQNERKKN